MTYKRFFTSEQITENEILLTADEYNHAVNVYRLKTGDEIVVFNGDGLNYFCEISKINKTSLTAKILKKEKNPSDPKVHVTLFQALIKGEKLELVTQKVTEIGVMEIVPFESKFSDVKKTTGKLSRLNKIVISACKQCGRSSLVSINDAVLFKDLPNKLKGYDLILIPYENEKNKSLMQSLKDGKNAHKIAVIVGPEGGFAGDEIDTLTNGLGSTVTLGNRVLRAETASLFTISVICSFFNI